MRGKKRLKEAIGSSVCDVSSLMRTDHMGIEKTGSRKMDQ